MNLSIVNLNISLTKLGVIRVFLFLQKKASWVIAYILALISIFAFEVFYLDGLGLAYNDARSHLDIGRRVVEGLKPGIAQLGSVWLPLPHALIALTAWNDSMWHSGLSGAIVSMISYVGTGLLINAFLKRLKVGGLGRLAGLIVFAANLNILYLQSTAMSELLLLLTMTGAIYELVIWHQEERIVNLMKSAFWVMLASLVRYEGWFLFLYAGALIVLHLFRKTDFRSVKSILENYKKVEGVTLFFITLAGLGIFLWFLWNLLIFKDALYFVFGPFSAHTQQEQLQAANQLPTKGSWTLSLITYVYAVAFNAGAFTALMGAVGAVALFSYKKLSVSTRLAVSALLSPFIFNVVALYFGHSVLFIQGIVSGTWFNVRYGVIMVPAIAIFIGFLIQRARNFRYVILGLIIFVTVFQLISRDAVTIDDARVGSSQKNVTEVSGWLSENAKNNDGFVLIAVASHDAIIFSSGLPMKKFIHEGTGRYWELATTDPSHWAKWIIMRTGDESDGTWRAVSKTKELSKYDLVEKYPFADIYQLKDEYTPGLITKPILGKQK